MYHMYVLHVSRCSRSLASGHPYALVRHMDGKMDPTVIPVGAPIPTGRVPMCLLSLHVIVANS